jgi:hypothetical protein
MADSLEEVIITILFELVHNNTNGFQSLVQLDHGAKHTRAISADKAI